MAGDGIYDLAIIGGGVNGCGIARDAAGRGLSVFLCEKDDLAQATSSASTKLFHGGLRYLEYFEFRLVREALIEREVLLRAMPHISWPMRFVLPYHKDMRFEGETPTSKLLGVTMPWMKGRRPAWLIRLGLFLYDHLGGRDILPGTKSLDLRSDPAGAPLKDKFKRAFEYSDCWVQDARLVALNAADAADKGAEIAVRTRCAGARRENGLWTLELEDTQTGKTRQVRARGLVNAAGPWVEDVIRNRVHIQTKDRIRLVRGSHIVVDRLFDHGRCYFFQGEDGRITFAIPYEDDFTLIGTTDSDHEGAPGEAACSDEEAAYLCAAASNYFKQPITPDQIVWSYSGVRPLYDDGATSATAATRDYVLKVEAEDGAAPLLNIFGGKITTYRRLAEAALEKLQPFFPAMGPAWTAGAALPGGDFRVTDVEKLVSDLRRAHPFMSESWARRMVRCYGTNASAIMNGAREAADLGLSFGATLTEAEVRWLMEKEWARTADDILWRRTKLGLRMTGEEADRLNGWMAGQASNPPATGGVFLHDDGAAGPPGPANLTVGRAT